MILYFDTIGEIVLRRSVALALSCPVKSTSHQSFACSFHVLHSGSPQVFFLSTPRLLRIPRDMWLCSSAAQLCYTYRITESRSSRDAWWIKDLEHVLMRWERNKEGWMRADEPDTAEGDDPEAAIGFVGEVCARAATAGEDGSEMRCRRWRSTAAQCSGGGTSRHWLRPSLRSGLGFVGRELGSGEPRNKSRRPPPLFIA